MIPKIILGKGPHATRRTIGYLFGKGRANEHIDPHLVASWNDFAPDPGRSPHRDPKDVEAQLVAQLDQPVKMLGDKAPKYTVWHCPVRAAPEDPILTDAQWADIARRIVAAAGIAPDRRRGSLPLGGRPPRRRPHPHRCHPRTPGRPPPSARLRPACRAA